MLSFKKKNIIATTKFIFSEEQWDKIVPKLIETLRTNYDWYRPILERKIWISLYSNPVVCKIKYSTLMLDELRVQKENIIRQEEDGVIAIFDSDKTPILLNYLHNAYDVVDTIADAILFMPFINFADLFELEKSAISLKKQPVLYDGKYVKIYRSPLHYNAVLHMVKHTKKHQPSEFHKKYFSNNGYTYGQLLQFEYGYSEYVTELVYIEKKQSHKVFFIDINTLQLEILSNLSQSDIDDLVAHYGLKDSLDCISGELTVDFVPLVLNPEIDYRAIETNLIKVS